jgi:hypothetical protein
MVLNWSHFDITREKKAQNGSKFEAAKSGTIK